MSFLQQWILALFLLCSPGHGRPIDAVSSRIKRSVSHAQLMHDKGRTLQDFKRRMWLQELLDEVHTAETRDLPPRPPPSGVGGISLEGGVSTTGSTMHSKPPGGTKNLPLSFREEEENLPQETNKSLRAQGKKKKKGRGGRRRGGGEGEKRKRRERSLGGEGGEEGARWRQWRAGVEDAARPPEEVKRCQTD
ncbi:parathyroid hormone-like hormone a [Eleginops maclovinus]|uniref:parathyroid hormone-like hormone a n=1 Tax=Eleginops maclovinus TaxID=56733 RepID=UPI0030808062